MSLWAEGLPIFVAGDPFLAQSFDSVAVSEKILNAMFFNDHVYLNSCIRL